MHWTPIEGSTAISQIGYDHEGRRLIIQSLNGTPYEYVDVPPEAHTALLAAPSKGKAWADIRKTFALQKGDGTLALQSPKAKPVEPKVRSVIEEATAKLPAVAPFVGESMALSVTAFIEAGLKERMDEFCAPIAARVDGLVSLADKLETVTDEQSYTLAAQCGTWVADERRAITKLLQPTKRAIDAVKQIVLDKEHDLLRKLETAEGWLSKRCTDYRTAEQRRANEAAEAERQRKLKEAEDARIAQAEMAQAAGKTKLAEKLLDTPVTAPRVEVKAAVPTGTGARGKVNYKWRVKDLAAVPREWLILDESKIGKHARDNKLPDGTVLNGIEFYSEPDTDF